VDDDEKFLARLESYGVTQVRQMHLAGEWAPTLVSTVLSWLSKKDQEERLRVEDSQADQVEIARSAKDAAWAAARAAERAANAAEIANKRAVKAIIIAAISAVISIAIPLLSILVTHHDATIR
jgi:hypothetical protein